MFSLCYFIFAIITIVLITKGEQRPMAKTRRGRSIITSRSRDGGGCSSGVTVCDRGSGSSNIIIRYLEIAQNTYENFVCVVVVEISAPESG